MSKNVDKKKRLKTFNKSDIPNMFNLFAKCLMHNDVDAE